MALSVRGVCECGLSHGTEKKTGIYRTPEKAKTFLITKINYMITSFLFQGHLFLFEHNCEVQGAYVHARGT